MLDPVQQRIVGVLIEKALTVPETYPLTAHALLAGCNQKSNRDPEMALEPTDLDSALAELMRHGWVTRIEGGRAARYRVNDEAKLEVSSEERAVLCELLIRGPQAPGALKPRIARMGVHCPPDRILDVLRGLRERALAEQLPRQPRERDWRWGHTLGPRAIVDEYAALRPPEGAVAHREPERPAPRLAPAPAPAPAATVDPLAALERRITARLDALEARLAAVEARLDTGR